MNDPEAIQRKLTELDLKLELLTKRTLAYVTTILQILHNQGVVGFREMLHYLNQNEKDFSKTPASRLDKEFIRIMKPLWLDPKKKQKQKENKKGTGTFLGDREVVYQQTKKQNSVPFPKVPGLN